METKQNPGESAEKPTKAALSASDPGHPDHELYMQIKSKLGDLQDEEGIRSWDYSNPRIAAGVLMYFKARAQDERMDDIKHIVRGKNRGDGDGPADLILVDGDLDSSASRRMLITGAELATLPMDDGLRLREAIKRDDPKAEDLLDTIKSENAAQEMDERARQLQQLQQQQQQQEQQQFISYGRGRFC